MTPDTVLSDQVTSVDHNIGQAGSGNTVSTITLPLPGSTSTKLKTKEGNLTFALANGKREVF